MTLIVLLFSMLVPVAPERSKEAGRNAVEEVVVAVSVTGTDSEATTYGAAIAVGDDDNFTYFVTARHLLAPIGEEVPPSSISIRCGSLSEESRVEIVGASLPKDTSDATDLIALRGAKRSDCPFPKPDARSILADASDAKTHMLTRAVTRSCNKKRCYANAATENEVHTIDTDTLQFSPNGLRTGFSGGALVTSDWKILGMVFETSSSEGVAYTLDFLKARTTDWGVPFLLESVNRSRTEHDRVCKVTSVRPSAKLCHVIVASFKSESDAVERAQALKAYGSQVWSTSKAFAVTVCNGPNLCETGRGQKDNAKVLIDASSWLQYHLSSRGVPQFIKVWPSTE